jgi:hypothetical protein
MSQGRALLPEKARADGDRAEPPEGSASPQQTEPNRRPGRWEWLAVGAVVWSLYAVACACPAYYETPFALDGPAVGGPVPGWSVLAFSWLLALLYPPAFIPWAANFLLLGGWVAFRRGRVRRAAVCGCAAVVAGFASFAMPHAEVERLLLGYYLWQASLLCFAAASAWCWWRNRAGPASARARIVEPDASADRPRD